MTETWASAYLQVIVSLLVFGLGVPAYVFQIAVRDEVKRILRRYWFLWSWHVTMLMVLFGILSIVLLWFVHPVGGGRVSRLVDIGAQAILTFSIVLILIFWWQLSQGPLFDRVVSLLRERIERAVDWYASIPNRPMEDLVALGRKADDPSELRDVVRAFGSISQTVQGRGGYKGRSLETVIDGIESIFISDVKRGDDAAFIAAAEVLRQISKRGRHPKAPDVGRSIRALTRLGACAAESRSEMVALALVEKISLHRVALFEMGRTAVRMRRYLIAVAALNRLESLVERSPALEPSELTNLLGLLAHFWSSGSASRERAALFFVRMRLQLRPRLSEIFQEASAVFGGQGDYATVDLLKIMQAEVVGVMEGVDDLREAIH